VNEQHLRSVLAEFVGYYNTQRPHRTLRLETPVAVARPSAGPIRARSALGGLHHIYERVA
jgi:transposase InsO family protein